MLQSNGIRADGRREGVAPGALPPGYRLGLRRRQAPQNAGLGCQVHCGR